MNLLYHLPAEMIDRLFTMAEGMQAANPAQCVPCPYCGESNIIRYGKKCGKQRFLCKSCNRTFVTTTHTVMSHSRQSAATWGAVIADTIYGRSIDFTTQQLSLSHQCVFDMRHKILTALEENAETVLGGVTELDETYVLDYYKGTKFGENSDRSQRKHGAVAEKKRSFSGICLYLYRGRTEWLCLCLCSQSRKAQQTGTAASTRRAC